MPKYSIVFEDDCLLVVEKDSGLLVIPTPKGETNTLTGRLNSYLDTKYPGQNISAHPCHRIDRDTSGLVLYAKGKTMQQKIMGQFHDHLVHKKYLAIIHGRPGKNENMISFRLGNKPAQTRYRVIKNFGREYSLAEAEPITGRTNQIRIHFKMIGHPVVGERRFAYAKNYQVKARRLMLHSASISFNHPATGQPLSFSSNPPEDMLRFL